MNLKLMHYNRPVFSLKLKSTQTIPFIKTRSLPVIRRERVLTILIKITPFYCKNFLSRSIIFGKRFFVKRKSPNRRRQLRRLLPQFYFSFWSLLREAVMDKSSYEHENTNYVEYSFLRSSCQKVISLILLKNTIFICSLLFIHTVIGNVGNKWVAAIDDTCPATLLQEKL